MSDIYEQLAESKEARRVLSDLQRKADALPALEAEARRQARIEDALRRQAAAKDEIETATAEALPLMRDYHQRLPKLKVEADALAGILDQVSNLLQPPYQALAASVAARKLAEAGSVSNHREGAALAFSVEQAIGEELENTEPPPTILSPFPRDRDPDAARLVNTLLLPKCKRTVFDPSRPVK